MSILFINACVREESRTYRLARAYFEKTGQRPDRIVALNTMDLRPLNRESLARREECLARGLMDAPELALAREFAEADTIVIAAPYWDFLCPASLKTYMEHICANGVTFGYPEGLPVGYCKAGELVYILTAGGYMPQHSALEAYLRELCAMFGIPRLRMISAQGLDLVENNSEELLQRAIEQI